MLNKKEIALINSEIESYRMWAKGEEDEARLSSTQDEKDEHLLQARLNDSAASALELLLIDLLL